MDVDPATWSPPPSLIDPSRVTGLPHHGIGRPCKVGKEEIAGLVTALTLALSEDADGSRLARYALLAEELAVGLNGIGCGRATVAADPARPALPAVCLAVGPSAAELARKLERGKPAIHTNPARHRDGDIVFGVSCLGDGDPARIVEAVRKLATPGPEIVSV
jgi:L-seryl-tRNA(Ser) seleniumtransferase